MTIEKTLGKKSVFNKAGTVVAGQTEKAQKLAALNNGKSSLFNRPGPQGRYAQRTNDDVKVITAGFAELIDLNTIRPVFNEAQQKAIQDAQYNNAA